MRMRKNYSEDGFTLFEIAAALAMVMIGIAGFLAVFSAALKYSRDVKQCLSAPEAARTVAAYCVTTDLKPATRTPVDIPGAMGMGESEGDSIPVSGFYLSVTAGRMPDLENNDGNGDGIDDADDNSDGFVEVAEESSACEFDSQDVGRMYTLRIEVFDNPDDRSRNPSPGTTYAVGTYFIRMWYRD